LLISRSAENSDKWDAEVGALVDTHGVIGVLGSDVPISNVLDGHRINLAREDLPLLPGGAVSGLLGDIDWWITVTSSLLWEVIDALPLDAWCIVIISVSHMSVPA
jgi:hypothetical protein